MRSAWRWLLGLFGRVPRSIRRLRFEKRIDCVMKTADMERR